MPRSKATSNNTRLGFTLIELMIVVVILAILTLTVVPGFSSYLKNQNLKQAQENLKSELRSVQNKALTGTGSDQQISGADVRYWGMQFADGGTTYIVFASATAPTGACPAAAATINRVTLQVTGGASFIDACISGACCMYIDMSDGDVTNTTNFSSVTTGICNGKPGVTMTAPGVAVLDRKHVCFNPHGLIYAD